MTDLSGEIDRIYEKQRANAQKVGATSVRERRAKIRRLHDALLSRREEIRAAMWSDFRKPPTEVDLSEVWPVATEARHVIRKLRKWMKPRRVPTPLSAIGTSAHIRYEPKGVVLIISPWNFPFTLTFGPLVSAVAAGNCVVIKPSELTPHSSALMKKIVNDLFGEDEVAVIEGDASIAERLLAKRFDHIFFTGSPRVGREVMKAAAAHLTSVTLELGGKSPVVVDSTANLDLAAEKVAFAKALNSGQTCIAPDYILVQRSVRDDFLRRLRTRLAKMIGEDDALRSSDGYTRIVNERHFSRIGRAVEESLRRGGKVLWGGGSDPSQRFYAPTVIEGLPDDSPLMQEEIFGPPLPVLEFDTLDEAIAKIRSREKPLILYIFSSKRENVDHVLAQTSSGSVCINDTLSSFYHVNIPFGGVGESGVGKAHGHDGFLAFSDPRPVVRQLTRFGLSQLLYPPDSKLRKFFAEITVRYF